MDKDFNKVDDGDSFIIHDKEFVLGNSLNDVPDTVYPAYCEEDDYTYYICRGMVETVGSRFGNGYLTVLYDIPDADFIMESMRPLTTGAK